MPNKTKTYNFLARADDYFTANELRKARKLAHNDYVDILAIEDLQDGQGFNIMSSVTGSRGEPYDQTIELYRRDSEWFEWSEWGEWGIEGFCSCPMGFNCKHVAAVLLFVEDNQQVLNLPGATGEDAAQQRSFSSWIEQLPEYFTQPEQPTTTGQDAADPRQPRVSSGKEFLIYHLEQDEQKQWVVTIYKTRRLKSGDFSKAGLKFVNIYNLVAATGASYIDSVHDPEIIAGLESCRIADRYQQNTANQRRPYLNHYHGNPYYNDSAIPLTGDLGFATLSKLLDSNRLFLGDLLLYPPLQLGAARAVEPCWRTDGDGAQTLALTDQGTIDDIIPVSPAMGIDKNQGLVFPLATTLTEGQMQQLLAAPAISPEESQNLPTNARQALEHMGLPRPKSISVHQVESRRQPEVQLTLKAIEVDDGIRVSAVNALSLAFTYPECPPISPRQAGSELSLWKGETLYKIPRHLKAEQEAWRHLEVLGARPLSEQYPENRLAEADGLTLGSMAAWHHLLNDELERLEAMGWTVRVDDSFAIEFVEPDDWYTELDGADGGDWFNLEIGVQVDGEAVNLLPILLENLRGKDLSQQLQWLRDNPEASNPVPLDGGRYINLPNRRLLPLLETFVELFDDTTLLDAAGRLRLATAQAGRLALLSGDDWRWNGGEKLRQLARKISGFSGVASVKPPASFRGKLSNYQQQGLNWLQFLRDYELGGILADDMGLGKTVQTLAHLCCEKAAGRLQQPSLIVATTSLVGNWQKEAAHFAPELRVLGLQGVERKHHFAAIAEQDLVITTYALLKHDGDILKQHTYYFLILDEAQNIKNPRSKSSQWVRACKAQHKFCLTGTPMENHLGELWSLYDFLMPGLLGGSEEFTRLYRTPIEKHGDGERHALLVKRVAPFLLRRTKQSVAKELPPKTEMLRSVELTGKQRDLYETIRLSMHGKVQREIARKGLAKSHIMILDALLKLRQVCCHPQLLNLSSAKDVQQSEKLDMLMTMLPEMVDEGRRILLFSQFTSMLSLIEAEVKALGIHYVKLTGQTQKREAVIERFQNREVPLFLISLKAGGVGLNLTAADTVIHYDPWWNPAVEDQATDRAYRIGQDKPVFVYKLTTENTLAAMILEMQERKRVLAEGTYGKKQRRGALITEQDLQELFKPL